MRFVCTPVFSAAAAVGLIAKRPCAGPTRSSAWSCGCSRRLIGELRAPSPPRRSLRTANWKQHFPREQAGLRAEDVARRSETTSPEVAARQRDMEAAAAKVDQAALNWLPRLSFTARYTRLSPIPHLSLGNIVASEQSGPVYVTCSPAAAAGSPQQCAATNAAAVPFQFPVILNQYSVQAGVAVPLSDYLLRISQNQAAASHNEAAMRVQEKAARAKVRRDARIAYFNWIRAKGRPGRRGARTSHRHRARRRCGGGWSRRALPPTRTRCGWNP